MPDASHWSTHLFLDTSKGLRIYTRDEAAFDDWKIRTTLIFGINFLVSMALFVAFGVGLGGEDEAVYVFLAVVLAWPSMFLVGWLDPSNREFMFLILVTLLHVTLWTWAFIRVMFLDNSSSWLIKITSTILLPVTAVNLFRITRWYWKCFLDIDMNWPRRQARILLDDEMSGEPYRDEDASAETSDNDDELLESHGDGLLDSIYRHQLKQKSHSSNLYLRGDPEDREIYGDGINLALPYPDPNEDDSSAPGHETRFLAMTDDVGEGPSTIPIVSPSQDSQDPPQTSQDNPSSKDLSSQTRFQNLSFEPRFRWQERVPLLFGRGLLLRGLGLGAPYSIFISRELYTERYYCKMKTHPAVYATMGLLLLSWLSLAIITYLWNKSAQALHRRLAIAFYMTPWVLAFVIPLVFTFRMADLPCEAEVTPDRSELEQEQCAKCGFRILGYRSGQWATAMTALVVGMIFCFQWQDERRVGTYARFKG